MFFLLDAPAVKPEPSAEPEPASTRATKAGAAEAVASPEAVDAFTRMMQSGGVVVRGAPGAIFVLPK
jgi:hypothetical protein